MGRGILRGSRWRKPLWRARLSLSRPTNRSFYLNLPAVLAEALDIQKGEQLQWSIEDKNTLILSRLKPQIPRRLRHKP